MPQDRDRRAAAVPRDITDIDPEQDVRVRVIGTVLEVREDSLVMDDGTGTAEVFVDADALTDVNEGGRIRILGRVLPTPESFELQGEIVQDMSGLDTDLYERVKEHVPRRHAP